MPDENNYAKAARDFITFNRNGILSTSSVSRPGYPLGSIVPYDVDNQGRLIILIADISEHYKNLSADNKASVLISDQFGMHDPQAFARAALLADFTRVPDDELEEIAWSYKSRFPEAAERERQHGFLYMRCVPTSVRWIGGFGEIGWIDGLKYSDVQPDPLAYIGWEIIQHMNRDHEKAMLTYIEAYTDLTVKNIKVQMTNICESSFTLQTINGNGYERVVLEFPHPVTEATEARRTLISMLSGAPEKVLSSATDKNL